MCEKRAALLLDDALLSTDDELDRHPCMLPTVQLLERAAATWQCPDAPGAGEMPEWAKTLKRSLESSPRYARLYITKVRVLVVGCEADRFKTCFALA